MGVNWNIVGATADELEPWKEIARVGLCGSFALLDWDALRVVRGKTGTQPAPVRVHTWRPRNLGARLAALEMTPPTYDVVDRSFDGFDLFLPRLRGSEPVDLRPFGLRYERAAPMSVLLAVAGLEGDDEDARMFARDAPAVARFCIKYGTLVEFSY